MILGGKPECSRWEQGKAWRQGTQRVEKDWALQILETRSATVTQCPGVEARKDQGSEFQGESHPKHSLREMEQAEQAGEAELYPE